MFPLYFRVALFFTSKHEFLNFCHKEGKMSYSYIGYFQFHIFVGLKLFTHVHHFSTLYKLLCKIVYVERF